MRRLDKEDSSSSSLSDAEIRVDDVVVAGGGGGVPALTKKEGDRGGGGKPFFLQLAAKQRQHQRPHSPAEATLCVSDEEDEPRSGKIGIHALCGTETKSPERRHKTVQFGDVRVRRYRLIVGDNPYTEVPLGLGWEYTDGDDLCAGEEDHDDVLTPPRSPSQRCTVDAYEERKAMRGNEDGRGYRHAQYMEPMDVAARQARLRSVGYTNEQIRREERIRRLVILQEWAYRRNREDAVVCTVPKAAAMFKRYVL